MFPLIKALSAPPTPEDLFSVLPKEGILFLDSARKGKQGKYSFIAFDPFKILCKNKENPFPALEAALNQFHLPLIADLPPFQGGIGGMLGYECGGYLEKIPRSVKDDLCFPEILFGFYDLVIAWDHSLEKAWLFSSGFPLLEPVKRLERAKKRLSWAAQFLEAPRYAAKSFQVIPPAAIQSPFTPETYQDAVQKVIDYIRAGDIFEANISQCFSATLPDFDSSMLYQRLRHYNPAPFAAFLQAGKYAIASASPERFLKLHQGKVEARPIKGTRPRSADPVEDKAFAECLLASEKDRVENIMIVDLMRNDLSRVCLPHTVKVPQLCELESFATVHHLVSAVEGELMPGYAALDLIKATFPGGSITGAPKIRAMEIIAELEPTVRGPYCGSVGYIGFNGECDFSITIRTYAIRDNFVTFQTGGAITVDSDPLEEYEETLAKAAALRRVLTMD